MSEGKNNNGREEQKRVKEKVRRGGQTDQLDPDQGSDVITEERKKELIRNMK